MPRTVAPTKPAKPDSRRPRCSTITCTFITSGRTSPASTPSLRATSTVSTPPLRLTITCCTRGSGAQRRIDASQQRDLGSIAGVASTGSIDAGTTGVRTALQRHCAMLAAIARDRARRLRRSDQRLRIELVGIGEAGFSPRSRARHALLDRVRAILDDAVLHAPVLAPRMLEVQVNRNRCRARAGCRTRVAAHRCPGRWAQAGEDSAMATGSWWRSRCSKSKWRQITAINPAVARFGAAPAWRGLRALTSTLGDDHGPVTR